MEKENTNIGFKNIFGNNHHPMLVYDKITMSILAVNDLAVSCYGYTMDEFLEMTFENLIPGGNAQKLYESLQSESFPIIHTGIWKHRKKDGSLVEVEITGSNINFNGKQAKLVMIEEAAGKTKDNEAKNLCFYS